MIFDFQVYGSISGDDSHQNPDSKFFSLYFLLRLKKGIDGVLPSSIDKFVAHYMLNHWKILVSNSTFKFYCWFFLVTGG